MQHGKNNCLGLTAERIEEQREGTVIFSSCRFLTENKISYVKNCSQGEKKNFFDYVLPFWKGFLVLALISFRQRCFTEISKKETLGFESFLTI